MSNFNNLNLRLKVLISIRILNQRVLFSVKHFNIFMVLYCGQQTIHGFVPLWDQKSVAMLSQGKILHLYELFKNMMMANRILMGIGLSKRDTSDGQEEYRETNCRNCFETCAILDIKPPTTWIEIRVESLRVDQGLWNGRRIKLTYVWGKRYNSFKKFVGKKEKQQKQKNWERFTFSKGTVKQILNVKKNHIPEKETISTHIDNLDFGITLILDFSKEIKFNSSKFGIIGTNRV